MARNSTKQPKKVVLDLQLIDLVLWTLCAVRVQGVSRILVHDTGTGYDRTSFDSVFAEMYRELRKRDDLDLRFNVYLHKFYGESTDISQALGELRAFGIIQVGYWPTCYILPSKQEARQRLDAPRPTDPRAIWPGYFTQQDPIFWTRFAARLRNAVPARDLA